MPSFNGNFKKKKKKRKCIDIVLNRRLKIRRRENCSTIVNIEISIILVKLKKIFPLIVSIYEFDLEDNNSFFYQMFRNRRSESTSVFFFFPLELELF